MTTKMTLQEAKRVIQAHEAAPTLVHRLRDLARDLEAAAYVAETVPLKEHLDRLHEQLDEVHGEVNGLIAGLCLAIADEDQE